MATKITAPMLRTMKQQGKRIVCVTSYDVAFANMADEAGIDVVLVGDSLGNVVMGYQTTLPVRLADVVHHTKAVRNGVKRALLVSDLPFGSYHVSTGQAVESAVELMRAGAEAVKLEGGYTDAVKALTKAGIPVMGHVGMTPQSVNKFGGFRVQGKGDAGTEVLETAQALDEAGVFGIVLELMPSELAEKITSAVSCPTIGIGAGVKCDGEIQVIHDILGLFADGPRHARRYSELRAAAMTGLECYAEDVRSSAFPGKEQSF